MATCYFMVHQNLLHVCLNKQQFQRGFVLSILWFQKCFELSNSALFQIFGLLGGLVIVWATFRKIG